MPTTLSVSDPPSPACLHSPTRSSKDPPKWQTPSEKSIPKQRQIERGTLKDPTCSNVKSVSLHIDLVFEGFPFWLYNIHPGMCTSIRFVSCLSSADLLRRVELSGFCTILIQSLLVRLGTSRLIFDANPVASSSRCPDVVLVSGQIPFLLEHLHQDCKVSTLGAFAQHFTGKMRHSQPAGTLFRSNTHIRWHRIRHCTVGGVTNFATLIGCVGPIASVYPRVTELRRSIHHIVNFGEQPRFSKCPPPQVVGSYVSHYTLADRLIPEWYHLPVFFPEKRSHSGWAKRILTVPELMAAHGIPRLFHANGLGTWLLTFPPVQALAALLGAVEPVLLVTASAAPAVASVVSVPVSSISLDDNQIWLPAVQRFLPNSWVDSGMTKSKSVKHDNAAVPSHLWDARFECLYPGSTLVLPVVRRYVLFWMQRRLWFEFRAYMCTVHGVLWAAHLARLRFHRRGRLRHIGVSGGGGQQQQKQKQKRQRLDNMNSNVVVCDQMTLLSKDILDTSTLSKPIVKSLSNLKRKAHGSEVTHVYQTRKRIRFSEVINVSLLVTGSKEFRNKRNNPIKESTVHQVKGVGSIYSKTTQRGDEILLERERYYNSEKLNNHSINDLTTNDTAWAVYATLLKEGDCGRDAILKFGRSTWWEWTEGSSLYFWRWGEFKEIARDGMVPFVRDVLPSCNKPMRKPPKDKIDKIAEKLVNILEKGYIGQGFVSSLIDVFDVPKGDDIRLVYNGTSCGLNKALWAPNFWLPFARSAVRLMDYNYYAADLDIGEMFLNFPLHDSMQEYSGVDFTHFKEACGLTDQDSSWLRWQRLYMGSRSSPYSAVRFYSFTEEFFRGLRSDKSNPLRWDTIILNLPGSEKYDPSKPKCYKWDELNKRIAGEIITFVDDGRATGQTIEHTWAISRRVASYGQYLGVQDACRKRWAPVRSPGPWAGSVFETTATSITTSVTREKWDKAKGLVQDLWNRLDVDNWEEVEFSYKELEVTRGFLGHMSMTFSIMATHLKGFHLLLALHLGQRDEEGWGVTDKNWKIYLDSMADSGVLTESERIIMRPKVREGVVLEPPVMVKPTQHFKDDVFTLQMLFEPEEPPKVNSRSAGTFVVRYGFGDASGTGFGSTVQSTDGIKYRIGVWGETDASESSNYKELENVVATIEEEAVAGNLKDSMLYFFTDNSTVEAALDNGTSKSRRLFELVVRFRKVQLHYGANVIVSHVSGKRMIAQGTDGVSRGTLNEGVGAGLSMMAFIPLHLSAIDRHPPLVEWIKAITGNKSEFLEPQDWYERGHDHDGGHWDKAKFWRVKTRKGTFIWTPPPSVADVALEELRKALLKRQESTHIIIIPRLLSTEWRKQLHKTADLVVSINAGLDESCWPTDMFEPLTFAFVFPWLPFFPWQRRGTPKMRDLGRKVPGLFSRKDVAPRDFLFELFQEQKRLQYLPEDVNIHEEEELDEANAERLKQAWGSKQQDSMNYHQARDGDHLMTPFECDFCIFQKIRKTVELPDLTSVKDVMLMAGIRRINLDAFWSRATSTVVGNRNRMKQALAISATLGLEGPYEHTCTYPNYDHCGWEVALQMVVGSRKAGRYANFLQFDTVRKYRSTYTVHAKTVPQANHQLMAFGDDRGRVQRMVGDKCTSYWYGRFFIGCKKRMGQDVRPNYAMTADMVNILLHIVSQKIDEVDSMSEKSNWLTFGTFFAVTYVLSLRGSEGLLLDLGGLHANIDKWTNTYVIVTLKGKLKNRDCDECHLLPCANVTDSGVQIRSWITRLMRFKANQGFVDGPAIADMRGKVVSVNSLDIKLVEVLEEMYDRNKDLFPPSLNDKDELGSFYQVYRTPRRSSVTRAKEKGVSKADELLINRWHQWEQAAGTVPYMEMAQHYTQANLLLQPYLRYTKAM